MKPKHIVRKAAVQDLDVVNALTDTMHKHLAGLYGLELSAEELGKHIGQPNRIVFHHQFIDIVVVKIGDKYYAVTLDKEVKSDELSRELRRLVDRGEVAR